MRHLKTLGLAIMAAMALLAFFGAGPASATVLCTTTLTEGCAAAGWHIPKGSVIEASQVGVGKIETAGETPTVLDECTGAQINQTTTTTGISSETVKSEVPVSGLIWESCTKTTDTIEGVSLELHWTPGSDNGTLTIKGGEITITTIIGPCTFGFGATARDLGELVGNHETPTIVVNTLLPKISGICPEARWTATFHVTGLIYPAKATLKNPPLFVSRS